MTKEEIIERIQKEVGLSKEKAKENLIESLKGEPQTDAMAFIQNSIEEAKMTADLLQLKFD